MPAFGVTVDELLSHTSGLRDWGNEEELAGWPRTDRVYDLASVLASASRQRALNYAPGTHWSYTNTGYNLAAIIVQRVSGQSLAEFTKARFFTRWACATPHGATISAASCPAAPSPMSTKATPPSS